MRSFHIESTVVGSTVEVDIFILDCDAYLSRVLRNECFEGDGGLLCSGLPHGTCQVYIEFVLVCSCQAVVNTNRLRSPYG